MYTNSDYERAHQAIEDVNTGKYPDIVSSCAANNANIFVTHLMQANSGVFTPDSFVTDEVKENRLSICNTCDSRAPEGGGTCKECACPIVWIANLDFKECPLGKW